MKYDYLKETYLGKQVVAYRYGKAPISSHTGGYVTSYNHAENVPECGVSMAAIEGVEVCNSFAVGNHKGSVKKYYYRGIMVGFGGDDEPCLDHETLVEISHAEYKQTAKDKILEKINKIRAKEYKVIEHTRSSLLPIWTPDGFVQNPMLPIGSLVLRPIRLINPSDMLGYRLEATGRFFDKNGKVVHIIK